MLTDTAPSSHRTQGSDHSAALPGYPSGEQYPDPGIYFGGRRLRNHNSASQSHHGQFAPLSPIHAGNSQAKVPTHNTHLHLHLNRVRRRRTLPPKRWRRHRACFTLTSTSTQILLDARLAPLLIDPAARVITPTNRNVRVHTLVLCFLVISDTNHTKCSMLHVIGRSAGEASTV